MGRKRRSGEEKAKIALEALREDKPLREIAEKYGVHPNQISTWKRQFKDDFDKTVVNSLSNEIPFYGYRKIALEAKDRYGIDLSFKRALRLR